MALEDEIDGLAHRIGAEQSRFQKLATRVEAYRETTQAYRRVFLDKDGEVTPAARVVLADLARIAGLGRARLGRTTEQLHFDEGQRRMALHIINAMHLDHDRLARMARKMREAKTDD